MKLWGMSVLLLAVASYGQSFDATLGSSQLFNSSGIVSTYKLSNNVSGWLGLGYAGKPQYGSFMSMQFNQRERINVGDQRLSGFLDVDEFDTHSFTVRGISFTSSDPQRSLTVFSGLLTTENWAPYLHSYSTATFSNSALGAVVYSRKWGTLKFHSLNLMGEKLTSIQSLGWRPSKTWLFAGAAGLGSGSPYFAGSGEYTAHKLDLRAAYTAMDHSFHRQEALVDTEPLGFNFKAKYKPKKTVNFEFSRESLLTYALGQPTATGVFDTGSASAILKGFELSGSASSSDVNVAGRASSLAQTMQIFSASRKITSRWRSFGSLVHLDAPAMNQNFFVAINEYKVNSRLTLRQNYTRTNGQNSNSVGISWSSNPISFSIDQNLYISPLAAAFGGKTVMQAWTFNIRLRLWHGTTGNADTFVAPDGSTKWGGYLSGLRYSSVAPATHELEFSKYIVRGVVADEFGRGVWGIAVKVGNETVVSGEDGTFFLYVKNPKTQSMAVDLASSLQSGWGVQSAPASVQGVPETNNEVVRIVVSRTERASR